VIKTQLKAIRDLKQELDFLNRELQRRSNKLYELENTIVFSNYLGDTQTAASAKSAIAIEAEFIAEISLAFVKLGIKLDKLEPANA
jgi:hypothetical protein